MPTRLSRPGTMRGSMTPPLPSPPMEALLAQHGLDDVSFADGGADDLGIMWRRRCQ